MTTTNTILFQFQTDIPERLDQARLEQAAEQVLQQHDISAAMLSIVVGTDAHIQELNRQYRGIDAPTDILSFPAEPMPEEIEAETGRYLGDLIIGLPYTARRVEQEAHTLLDELMLLVIHGTLHLLGYDHDTSEQQRIMWDQQAQALQALGIDLTVPDYIHDEQSD